MSASLKDIVLPMATDPHLRDLAIKGGLQWDFKRGYAPLWLRGNWQEPEKVKLVLLLAEPSTPDPWETFPEDPEGWFDEAVLGPDRIPPFGTVRQDRQFQKKFEWFLGLCGFNLDDHKQVWSQVVVSNTFWLRLPDKFGRPPKNLADYFIERYLTPMLRQFCNAEILGAGNKAHARLNRTGIPYLKIGALAPPGCNLSTVVKGHVETAWRIRKRIHQ